MPSLRAPTADAIVAVRHQLGDAGVEVRGSNPALHEAWRKAVASRDQSRSSRVVVLLVDPGESDLGAGIPPGSLVLFPHLRADGPTDVLDAATALDLLARSGIAVQDGGLHAGWLLFRVADGPGDPQGAWWTDILEREVLVQRDATLRHAWSVRDREQLELALEGARARIASLRELQRDELARQRSGLLEARRQLATLRSQLQSAQERAERFRARSETLEHRLTQLQQRRWWRLGEELNRATASPGSLVSAPRRLVAVLRAGPARAERGSPAEPSVPTLPAETTSADPGQLEAVPSRTRQVHIPRLVWPQVAEPLSDRRLLVCVPDRVQVGMGFEVTVERLTDASIPHALVDGVLVAGLSGPLAEHELQRIAELRRRGVPAALWVTDERLLDADTRDVGASFDVVYAATAPLAERTSSVLRAAEVQVLPFAIQPRIHNPQEVPGGREGALGWYVAPEVRDGPMAQQLRDVAKARGAAVLASDRGSGALPPLVTLDEVAAIVPERDLPAAWRRFQAFLEPAPAVEDGLPTSSRLVEILACGTPIVATPGAAEGGASEVPDGIVEAAAPDGLTQAVDLVLNSGEFRDRARVRAIRAAHRDRTYGRVLATIGGDLGWTDGSAHEQPFSAVVATMRPEALDAICANLRRQTYRQVQLVLLTHGFSLGHAEVAARLDGHIADLQVIEVPSHLGLGAVTNVGFSAADGAFIGKMDDDDHYGPHYVSDQVRAFGYADAAIVGKRSIYTYLRSMDVTVLRWPGKEHRYVDDVAGATIVMRREVLRDLPFPDHPRAIDTQLQRRATARGFRIYATDRFNFLVVRGSDPGSHTWRVDDLELASTGKVAYHGWNTAHVDV